MSKQRPKRPARHQRTTRPVPAVPVETLVRILAQQDAAMVPVRNWQTNEPINAHFARKKLAAYGLPFVGASGGDSTARMAMARDLDVLQRAGLVKVSRLKGQKFIHVKLTDQGDDTARRLTDLPLLGQSWALLKDVAGRTNLREATKIQHVWVYECDLLPKEQRDDQAKWLALEFKALPAMACSWLTAWTTTPGHAFYALTPFGWEALEAGEGPPDEPAPPPGPEELSKLYADTMREALDLRVRDKVQDVRETGGIPLPVSYWDVGLFGCWWPVPCGRRGFGP